jgi:hypothetical protein
MLDKQIKTNFKNFQEAVVVVFGIYLERMRVTTADTTDINRPKVRNLNRSLSETRKSVNAFAIG